MGLLVFADVTAFVVGGPLVWMALRSFRARQGTTNMVLIWHSNSEADKAITVGALQTAGTITPRRPVRRILLARVWTAGQHGIAVRNLGAGARRIPGARGPRAVVKRRLLVSSP
jgi:hypothetical protein